MKLRAAGSLPMLAAVMLIGVAVPAVTNPLSILWTAPLMLLAAMMIAWGAETAQFFMAQGFALAILAWLQTMPEFAVEAVLAWRQRTDLLLSNLAGALQLLTGLGWPMIYAAAAQKHRQREHQPLHRIRLGPEHGVQIVALLICLMYGFLLWAKNSLHLIDSVFLVALYGGYLYVLGKLPSKSHDDVEDLPSVLRAIVTASKPLRIAGITALFAAGGVLIYVLAEPFLESVLSLALRLGLSSFVAIKWIAPFVSEFPEKVSALKWARTPEGASMALMNMVSSNINQWTLLAAMLPLVLSISRRHVSGLVFDQQQSLELLMTLGQALLGALFLIAMELVWWEAAALFALWAVQFAASVAPGAIAVQVHWAVASIYLAWCAVEVLRIALGRRQPRAFVCFAETWRRARVAR
jgi:cation:H+ antiporter